MNRYSLSYVIKEMLIKSMWYCWITIRMAKNQNTDNTKCLWGCGVTGTFIHCWWESKMVQPLRKTIWLFLIKLNIFIPYDPAIAVLSYLPKGVKNSCTLLRERRFVCFFQTSRPSLIQKFMENFSLCYILIYLLNCYLKFDKISRGLN